MPAKRRRRGVFFVTLSWSPARSLLHGKFWLRPDARCLAIVLGVFGKALQLYDGIQLHAFDAQSNHLHYMLSATKPEQISLFMDYVHANIAKQINALRKRSGVFWSRRAAVIAVVDGPAQIARLRYLLAQGPAAGLVASPRLWPGASSTKGLLGDMRIAATYVSLDRRRRNASLAKPLPEEALEENVEIHLAPLPVWEELDADSLRAEHAALVESIEVEHRGKRFLGARAVRLESYHRAPRRFTRSPMPRCHASTARSYRRYWAAYLAFRDAYRCASARLRGDRTATREAICQAYPPGAIARPGWYIPIPAGTVLPWLQGHDDADAFQVRN